LLAPIYEDAALLRSYLGPGMRDVIDPATDFASSANYYDILLNGLTDMAVRLGGKIGQENRWRFSCCLLSKDLQLPLSQRNLVVRAQSVCAPYKLGVTTVTPQKHAESPSIRALQGGHIVYIPRVLPSDASIAFRDMEGPIRSVLAVPIGGEEGSAIAVLYITSFEQNAFQESDLRVLRIVARMIEEVLCTYYIRQRVTRHLGDLLRRPDLVDTFFESFLSEVDFIHDVEALLSSVEAEVKKRAVHTEQENETLQDIASYSEEEARQQVTSFICVDIDKQNSLASKYGDRIARSLTREVGARIQEQLRTFFKEYPYCQLYHINADRFFIMLKQTPLNLARTYAERLRHGLVGSYKLDALHTSTYQSTRPESMLEFPNISVRLGVTSYTVNKLEEILSKYSSDQAISEVRSIITSALAVSLERGRNEGGNVVISWDREVHRFVRLG
jgi:GGDEF domain-containing protein